jgi:hypothetical protein
MEVTIQMTMGRLLEIRVSSGFRTVEEVDAMFGRVASVVASHLRGSGMNAQASLRHVTIADWRKCVLMSTEAASRLQEGMASTNANVIRAAALASRESPSAVMQFLRIIRDSQHEGRKLFFEEEQVVQWLGEVLTVTETARLRQFLREGMKGVP